MLWELSRERYIMDVFGKASFGGRDGEWGVSPYNCDDVDAALNSVAPHDWATFLRRRVNETSGEAPKGGFAKGGYKLVYTSQPNSTVSSAEDSSGSVNLTYGAGLGLSKSGEEIGRAHV